MKVTIGDRVYLIEFAYAEVFSEPYKGQRQMVDNTVCLIRDGSAAREPKTPAPILASGSVVRYFKDPPNRESARKAALAEALRRLDPSHSMVKEEIKARHKAFWTVYLNRKKKPATKMDGLIAELAGQEMVHSTKP